jgi:hypothetical protein
MLEKIEDKVEDDEYEYVGREWIGALNCARLHSKFGEKTLEQVLSDLVLKKLIICAIIQWQHIPTQRSPISYYSITTNYFTHSHQHA